MTSGPNASSRSLAGAAVSAADATRAMRRLAHVAGGDPYGVRTIAGAKAAYVRGSIDVDELERRVEVLLEGGEVEPPRDPTLPARG